MTPSISKTKRPSPARPSSTADLVCARDEIEVQDAVLRYLQGVSMKRTTLFAAGVVALLTSLGLAFQAQSDGPYKVLKTAKVGGEGGTDYIFADPVGRRRYITRGATQAQPATDARSAVPAFEKRL